MPMSHDEALRIVVQAGPDGQKELLKALCQEMNSDDLKETLEEEGFTVED